MNNTIKSDNFRKDIANRLLTIDWKNEESFFQEGRKILLSLANNRPLLKILVYDLLKDPKLFSLSERYDFFDKLVLFEDPNNYFRIRLSIFSRFESNRPHFHRWSYVAHVLKGNYLHSVFGDEYQLINPTNKRLFPTNIYEVNENDTYFLDHSRVHAVKAKEGTVSLLLQGPPQKEKFLVIDRKTNRKWWEYGSNQETFDEQLRKKMSQERLVQMISFLTKTEIL